jgi:hypothetical protein
MSADRDDIGSGEPTGGRRQGEDRLARLAADLGLELPPFSGPLIAFDPAEDRSPGDPVYLGGDLHAVHPGATAGQPPSGRDRSLDAASITLTDFDHPPLEAIAVEGVWCLAIEGGLLDSAPYFSISDSDGRLRTWILLPRFHAMIGMVHLWLPAVPPPPEAGGEPGRLPTGS